MLYAIAFLVLFVIWDWIGDLVLFLMGLAVIWFALVVGFAGGIVGLIWIIYS